MVSPSAIGAPSYVALPLTVDDLAQQQQNTSSRYYNDDEDESQPTRLVHMKRVAVGSMAMLLIGAAIVGATTGMTRHAPPKFLRATHDSAISSMTEAVVPSQPKSKDAALEERLDALGYMDKSRQHGSTATATKSTRSSSMVTKGQQLDPFFSKEDLLEDGFVFQVVEEHEDAALSSDWTQRKTVEDSEDSEDEEDSKDSEDEEDSKDSEDEEPSADSEEEETSTDSADELAEDDFLSTYNWTEKDFMVIDFSTDEYETKDLNRVQGGE